MASATQLVIVPIYWGWNVPPLPSDSFTVFDVLREIVSLVGSHLFDGMPAYGLAPTATYDYGATVPGSIPVPSTFTDDDCTAVLNRALSEGWVRKPDTAWNDILNPLQQPFRAVYCLLIAPGHSFTDPNIFGKNYKQFRPQAAGCWATFNSDLAGGIQTLAHEIIEGGSGQEIVDDCRNQIWYSNGVKLSKYKVNGVCWPDDAQIFRWLLEDLLAASRYKGTSLAPHFAGLSPKKGP